MNIATVSKWDRDVPSFSLDAARIQELLLGPSQSPFFRTALAFKPTVCDQKRRRRQAAEIESKTTQFVVEDARVAPESRHESPSPTGLAGGPMFPVGLGDEGFLRLTQIVGDGAALPPIRALVPVGKTTIWAWVKAGKFPAPIKLGPSVTVWSASEVRGWLATRRAAQGLD